MNMNSHSSLFTFGTFGNPNGYKHSLSFGNKETLSVCSKFDLNTNAIKLFEGSKLFSIKKGVLNNKPALVFAIYSHALESNSNRDGTFIGCSLICIEKHSGVPSIMKMLHEYHARLKELNTQNSRLTVVHSNDFKLPSQTSFPSNITFFDIPKFESSSVDSKILIWCDINNLKELWNDSLLLLDKYSEIFFTQSEDIAKFVHQKGLYKIIQHSDNQPQLLTELENIQIEKNKNHQQNIASLENRRASVLSQIKEIQSNLTSTLREKEKEKNSINADIDKIQRADAKLKDVLRNCDSDFNNLIKAFSSRQIMMDQVRSKENQIQNNVQNELQSLRDIIQHYQTSKRIQEHQFRTNQHSNSSSIKTPQIESHDNRGFGTDIFEIASIILSILLIGSWVYFLFFQDPEIVYQNPPNTNQETIQNLIPNAYLQPSELNNVNKKLKKDMNIDTIVSIIFQQNQNDVARHYKKDIHNYKIFLYNNNKHCFLKANRQFTLIEDSLVIIPCYK